MVTGGIFESTIEEIYAMDELMHFRGSCFINFFTQCMAVPDRCVSISRLVSSGAANKIEIAAADNYLSSRDY
jgi:hypothetical protein